LRFLLVEAAQVTVRSDQEWRSKYFHLAMRRGRKIAKVAMARRLAVRMYWRKGWNYEQMTKFSSHAGQPGNRDGVPACTEMNRSGSAIEPVGKIQAAKPSLTGKRPHTHTTFARET
jgi:hypothetical protein